MNTINTTTCATFSCWMTKDLCFIIINIHEESRCAGSRFAHWKESLSEFLSWWRKHFLKKKLFWSYIFAVLVKALHMRYKIVWLQGNSPVYVCHLRSVIYPRNTFFQFESRRLRGHDCEQYSRTDLDWMFKKLVLVIKL